MTNRAATARPAAGRWRPRRPLTLRRQLVLVVVGLLVALLTVLAVVSALVLRGSLSDQLDDQLRAAAARSANFPGRTHTPVGDDASEPGTSTGTGGTGTGEVPPATRSATSCTSTSTAPGGSTPPPGQAAGQIAVSYRDGQVADAFYIDDAGCLVQLTTGQLDTLLDVPADGRIHTVTLDELGRYHALAATTRTGEPSVTALPTAAMDSTVREFVLLEVGLGVAGALVAWVVGSYLVRRSLTPLDRVAGVAQHVSELPLDRGEVAAIRGVEDRDTDERTEVGTMGAALNRMLDNVETSLAARHESETQVRQFVADASHELRTPLASIRGYSELVRRSPEALPPDAARAIDRIESEALRMGGLVDDLLLLARLDAGRPLDRAPVDVAALAVDAVTDAHAAGPEHRFELELPGRDDERDEGTDLTVTGDEARLRQVLTNLVGNARVHTPAGTTVVVAVAPEPGGVVLRVRDDGPGIPATLLPSLFQRFSRGDTARNRTGGSTGLGLAIASAIVQAHGGTITVASTTAARTPTGTTFTVRLPRGA
jgi:two-component system OmpR family sensor kinase